MNFTRSNFKRDTLEIPYGVGEVFSEELIHFLALSYQCACAFHKEGVSHEVTTVA